MQAVLRIESLPNGALEASAVFHAEWMDRALANCDSGVESVALVVSDAPYDHGDWRRAAVRDLARRLAPVRVNMLAGGDPAAIDAALAYLASAPGITGQLLHLAGTGSDGQA